MKALALIALIFLPPAPVYSLLLGADSADTVDKIAVVVGDQVILASELANQLQLSAFQSGQRPKTEKEIHLFHCYL